MPWRGVVKITQFLMLGSNGGFTIDSATQIKNSANSYMAAY